jgi:hypothetical protein
VPAAGPVAVHVRRGRALRRRLPLLFQEAGVPVRLSMQRWRSADATGVLHLHISIRELAASFLLSLFQDVC